MAMGDSPYGLGRRKLNVPKGSHINAAGQTVANKGRRTTNTQPGNQDPGGMPGDPVNGSPGKNVGSTGTFQDWWKQNRPEDFYSRRDWKQGPQTAANFEDFQHGDILKKDMRQYYRQGIDPTQLTKMMKFELANKMNQPGGAPSGVSNVDLQNQFFNKFPGTYEAYMGTNDLVNTAGWNGQGTPQGSVYNQNDFQAGNVYFDNAGNPHTIPKNAPGQVSGAMADPAWNSAWNAYYTQGGPRPGSMQITDPTRNVGQVPAPGGPLGSPTGSGTGLRGYNPPPSPGLPDSSPEPGYTQPRRYPYPGVPWRRLGLPGWDKNLGGY